MLCSTCKVLRAMADKNRHLSVILDDKEAFGGLPRGVTDVKTVADLRPSLVLPLSVRTLEIGSLTGWITTFHLGKWTSMVILDLRLLSSLTTLVFGKECKVSLGVDLIYLPPNLVRLDLGGLFDKGYQQLPDTIRHLRIGPNFNTRVVSSWENQWVLPKNLVSLEFHPNGKFDRKFVTRTGAYWKLPDGLKTLRLPEIYSRPLNGWKLPHSITEIDIGTCNPYLWISLPWKFELPPSVKRLNLGRLFDNTTWMFPGSVTHIWLGNTFNQSVNRFSVRHGVTHLALGDGFNKSVSKWKLPETLRYLRFGKGFNQPVKEWMLPSKLTHLILGDGFNRPVIGWKLPDTLTHLSFGDGFDQPVIDYSGRSVVQLELPAGLTHLALGMSFKCWVMLPDGHWVLPKTLQFLRIGSPEIAPEDPLDYWSDRPAVFSSFNQSVITNWRARRKISFWKIPQSLRWMDLGPSFDQDVTIDGKSWPIHNRFTHLAPRSLINITRL